MKNDFNVTLTEKCILLVDSCYELKPFQRSLVSPKDDFCFFHCLSFFQMDLSFFKDKKRIVQEKVDMCNKGKRQMEVTKIVANGFGLNFNCPVKNDTVSFWCGI